MEEYNCIPQFVCQIFKERHWITSPFYEQCTDVIKKVIKKHIRNAILPQNTKASFLFSVIKTCVDQKINNWVADWSNLE